MPPLVDATGLAPWYDLDEDGVPGIRLDGDFYPFVAHGNTLNIDEEPEKGTKQ